MKYIVIEKKTGKQVNELGSRLLLNPFSGRLYDCGKNVSDLYELVPVSDFVIDEAIRDQVIKRLSKSINEQIVFEVIWNETIGKNRNSGIILPCSFEQAGCHQKRLRSLAIKRLHTKGLIFKGQCDAHYEQHRCTRYSVILDACKQFVES
jgi:hypothetical protein